MEQQLGKARLICFFFQLFSLLIATPSTSDERAHHQISKAFLGLVSSIGAIRASNRSVGIDVTNVCRPIVEQFSIIEFRNYVAKNYRLEKTSDWSGNYESVDISYEDLRKLDNRFLDYDVLAIVFKYNDQWNKITVFQCDLGNSRPTL